MELRIVLGSALMHSGPPSSAISPGLADQQPIAISVTPAGFKQGSPPFASAAEKSTPKRISLLG